VVEIKRFQRDEIDGLTAVLSEQFKIKEKEDELRIERILNNFLIDDQYKLSPCLLVAQDALHGVMGYIIIQWLTETWSEFSEAFISNFYVKIVCRQKGIGGSLLNQAIAEAKKRRCSRLFLESNRNNLTYEAQYYQNRGFNERSDLVIFELFNEANA
jgi:ribosomal protein S18 acetylase RimI-like enzyme